jgi:hypothetical protein
VQIGAEGARRYISCSRCGGRGTIPETGPPKCDRLEAGDGLTGLRMVRCQRPAAWAVHDSDGKRLSRFCSECLRGVSIYPGWTVRELS